MVGYRDIAVNSFGSRMMWQAGLAAVAAVAWLCSGSVLGAGTDVFPSKPVRLVVPYSAGGSTDAVARLLAHGMASKLGQPVVVDNRPGANGLIGTEAVARSPADGYTVLLGPIATNSIAASLYSNLSYDPIKDFVAITEVARTPLLLVVAPSFPAKTVQELQAYAKANPGRMNYGSGGVGTASHVAAAVFAQKAGVQMQHVPYKGSGQALNDVMGGHVQVMFDSIATSLPNVRGGKLKALGISTATRSSIAPEIPTLEEFGLTGFDIVWWWGLFAPAGTPAGVVGRLGDAAAELLRRPETRDSFLGMGLEPVGSSPEEFGRKVVDEARRWAEVLKAAGVEPGG